jgi:amidohydrolase
MLAPMPELYERIDAAIDRIEAILRDLAAEIHGEPEVAFAEHRAADRICRLLQSQGLETERPVGGVDTAFRARIGADSGPCVALLAEYDALPEIGHACGHNLIAGASVGAFLALAALEPDLLPGSIALYGTPAEEGGGGKIRLLEAGAFESVDAAMMFHPFDRDLILHPTLANCRLELRFEGRPSHAAIAPWDGASALTPCLDTFRLVDGQRVHLRDGVRVHGFVREGGQAANIIVERAVAEFSIRAPTTAELDHVRSVVERCARGAAMAAAVSLQVAELQGYREIRNNEPLARRFAEHLAAGGRRPRDTDPRAGTGSTDAGNLSHAFPVIHPWLAICDEDEAACHQHRFASMASSDRGYDTMVLAARCLARTAADYLCDPELRERVQRDFRR